MPDEVISVLVSVFRIGILGVAVLASVPDRGFAQDAHDPPVGSVHRDARALAALAPRSRRSTENVTYGDAAFARSATNRQFARRSSKVAGAEAPLGIYFCDTQQAGPANEDVCVRDLRNIGYRDYYLFAPSYATAPQVGRQARNSDSILPPATAFFYSANSRLFGPTSR